MEVEKRDSIFEDEGDITYSEEWESGVVVDLSYAFGSSEPVAEVTIRTSNKNVHR